MGRRDMKKTNLNTTATHKVKPLCYSRNIINVNTMNLQENTYE